VVLPLFFHRCSCRPSENRSAIFCPQRRLDLAVNAIKKEAAIAFTDFAKGLNGLKLLLPALALALLPVGAAAQPTSPLNDTGQTQCYNASNAAVACDEATTGNNGALPGQDGRYGRDAAQAKGVLPAKIGGGAAGFDFTPLDASGATMNTPGGHQCVKDNVTGLIWSTETLPERTWADANDAALTYTRCGYPTGWRLPTRRELLSIVHWGRASSPTIDSTYFPSTHPSGYWTADTYAPSAGGAWYVYFYDGNTGVHSTTIDSFARLVRSGQ
jgi:hypothetical protein